MVNYYQDMWRKRSHVLTWKGGEEQSKAFQQAKKILSKEVLLAFPIFDKTFTIHTDASH
jgi:hypothetical protein